MKALRFHEYGGPEVLKIDDVPVPEPSAGKVLVRVHGSGINPVDLKILDGSAKEAFPVQLPATIGNEFSGTIEKLGDGVEGYAVGDDVYGIQHGGSCADYIVADTETFAKAPPTMDLPDAGGIPLAAMTAWQGLFDQGGLKGGERVLILNGTGGVGTFAVQMAKWAGAYVYTTGSAKRLDILGELGADRPIDYKAEKASEVAKDVDLVLDLIGGVDAKEALACVKEGGRYVSTVPPGPGGEAKVFMMKPSPEQLTKIGELIGDLKIRPVIDTVVPLIRAVEAYKEAEQGHTLGKMVIDVRR